MFEVNNLSIIVDNKYLVHNLSFHLNKNDKLAIIGEEEEKNGTVSLKNMKTGEQEEVSVEELVKKLK